MSAKSISPTAMDRLWSKPNIRWVAPDRRAADLSAGCQKSVSRTFVAWADSPVLWATRVGSATADAARGTLRSYYAFDEWKPTVDFVKEAFKAARTPLKYFDGEFPCRKCSVCLKRRAAHWRIRAKLETALSHRTWFATFTLNPQERFKVDIQRSGGIVRELRSIGAISSFITEDQLFTDRHLVIGKLFTNYFKRLRKNTRVSPRYLLVAERHADGWPHYHALLHEREIPITKRQLEAEWKHGFTSFKLVQRDDPAVSNYVCKYIAKQALARIRASLRYGHGLCHSFEDEMADVWPPLK